MPCFVLTNKAKADLKSIGRYTADTWGREQRNRYLALLDKSFHELAASPRKGRDCGAIRPGYRKHGIGRHIVFYRQITADCIEIVRVLHGRPELKKTIGDQINAFDKWFQYAEQIGQQRLYNFLMAASIIFVGCATLMASTKNTGGHILAILLSLLGIGMSWMWYILGRRQAKFHDMLEKNLRKRFEQLGYPDNCEHCDEFPIYHVYQMKIDNNELTCLERKWSNRLFLSAVPKWFGFAFFITLIITIIVFTCEMTKTSSCLCKYFII